MSIVNVLGEGKLRQERHAGPGEASLAVPLLTELEPRTVNPRSYRRIAPSGAFALP